MEFGEAAVCWLQSDSRLIGSSDPVAGSPTGICVDFRARNTLGCLEIDQYCEGGE
jgi:hypothetical protein